LGTERFRHPGGVGRLQFSPDGKALLSVGYRGDAIVWDVETGRRQSEEESLKPFRHKSPDGCFRAVYLADRTEFEIRDTATDRVLFARKNEFLWESVGFAKDSKSVVALGRDNRVRTWRLPSGALDSDLKFDLRPWPQSADDFPPPVLSPDGSILSGVLAKDW